MIWIDGGWMTANRLERGEGGAVNFSTGIGGRGGGGGVATGMWNRLSVFRSPPATHRHVIARHARPCPRHRHRHRRRSGEIVIADTPPKRIPRLRLHLCPPLLALILPLPPSLARRRSPSIQLSRPKIPSPPLLPSSSQPSNLQPPPPQKSIKMKDLSSVEYLTIPEGVDVQLKARTVTVTGPRGTLTKTVRHIQLDMQVVSILFWVDGEDALGGVMHGSGSGGECVCMCVQLGRLWKGIGLNDKTVWEDLEEEVGEDEISLRLPASLVYNPLVMPASLFVH